MTATHISSPRANDGEEQRFRLHRAGVLNVWQYDEQVFEFAEGRLLLRGANGAGKSKTLEMLLPFALDGDKARITASAKHHTSLLWLMTDGIDGGNRVGYVWVEFQRPAPDDADDEAETYTCGVGIRASVSGRSATAWHFATDRRIGDGFSLEDDAGPLSMPRLKEVLGDEHVFEKAADYKAHVGRTLFGLDPGPYDEVLRLLYWLRQPQIGEDIEPAKLAQQLSQALPQLEEQSVRAAGDTFDELTAFGEQIERRAAAAGALSALAYKYADYARATLGERARAVLEALRRERSLRNEVATANGSVEQARTAIAETETEQERASSSVATHEARLRALEDTPEFRSQRRLTELRERAERDAARARDATDRQHRQGSTVERLDSAAGRRLREVTEGITQHDARLHDTDRRLRHAVPDAGLALAPTPAPDVTDDVSIRGDVEAGLERSAGDLHTAASAATHRLAAVGVVRGTLRSWQSAVTARAQAESTAEAAERRWESARAVRIEAVIISQDKEVELASALERWANAPAGIVITLPSDLDDAAVTGLSALATAAAEPVRAGAQAERARHVAAQERAEAELTRLQAERETIAAERDPAPPSPVLPRTARVDGLALWQVLDFADGVDPVEAAGLEAALQASGLLDAWVRPGGRLLGADDLDVVLAAGGPVDGSTLARYLVPDLPDAAGLVPDDVRRLLGAIGAGATPDATTWIAPDGSWRLGPAHGRARKVRAQYIGATARAQERTRRLALLDEAIAGQQEVLAEAQRSAAALDEVIVAIQAWLAALPSGQDLLNARGRVVALQEVEDREADAHREAQAAAHAARRAAAEARERLDGEAAAHLLPVEERALDAVEQEVRGVAEALRDAEHGIAPIRVALASWAESVAELKAAQEVLAADTEAQISAESEAVASRAEFEALQISMGDSIEQLQRRTSEARRALAADREAFAAATSRLRELEGVRGRAEAQLVAARQRLEEHLGHRARVLAALAALDSVPGLPAAAGIDDADAVVVRALGAHPAGEPVGRTSRASVERLAAVSTAEATALGNRVYAAHQSAMSGPAADHQPAVALVGDLLVVSGHDDAGEAPVVTLAARVEAAVARDRELLTDREKQQFEQHVLGELGDAIRLRRRDAEELVVAMNEQLGHVTTSQGIKVRLDWRLRDDVPPEARSAVELLAQPVGALLPEERAQLRDVLHRLIDAARAERPELSYGEHLAAALDYRTWSQFTIRYTRPERDGQWDRLHRRSPLSQGEQKVLCYLPLFAAAAAHFTSLAGAAPHAPRLVLLDDAFPKIDVRTHPLLFGLLVQLDLDFVITSERLWGDHATVPSLAIYEALRDPSQRGIAQYEYRWDGRMLQGVG